MCYIFVVLIPASFCKLSDPAGIVICFDICLACATSRHKCVKSVTFGGLIWVKMQTVKKFAKRVWNRNRHTQAPRTLKRERLAATLSFALSSSFPSSTGKTQKEKKRKRMTQKCFHENNVMKPNDFRKQLKRGTHGKPFHRLL